ncbi:MAG TPA: hypothetical protein VFU86_02505, partial [Terriglobales bacterium]|nr:hypothetical protein [Terriglobales bacterium]
MRASSASKRQLSPSAAASPHSLSLRATIFLGIAILALIFAVYSPSLGFQFILDDHRFLSDPRLQSAGHLWDYFTNY